MQNNLFFELIPLALFFGVYSFTKNIFLATSICIASCWIQVAFCKLVYKQITRNLWISTILITLFGGLTVILHNKTFIMLKPTVLYWILATILLISQIIGKNIIKSTLGKEVKLTQTQWNILSTAWSIFFIALGILNLFIAFHYSEYTWVRFKVFGTLLILVGFSIVSGIYILINNNKQK